FLSVSILVIHKNNIPREDGGCCRRKGEREEKLAKHVSTWGGRRTEEPGNLRCRKQKRLLRLLLWLQLRAVEFPAALNRIVPHQRRVPDDRGDGLLPIESGAVREFRDPRVCRRYRVSPGPGVQHRHVFLKFLLRRLQMRFSLHFLLHDAHYAVRRHFYGGDNDSIKYLNDIRLWTGVPGGLLISFLGLYYGGATQDPPAVMKHCPWDERV
ncbi:unnamed protein product, partial [Amoebophrya sp. A120]